MGKRSMYSRTLEHGEKEFNEELGKNERLAAQDMANEWMKFGGMSLLDFGMLPFPSVMLPYINFGRLAGFIENNAGVIHRIPKDSAQRRELARRVHR